MTIVKGSTKKGQDLIWRANHNLGDNIYKVYPSGVSQNKVQAMENCREWYNRSKNGRNLRIVSKSTYCFSVAWEMDFEYMDPKTGEITTESATRIETRDNTYIVLLNR